MSTLTKRTGLILVCFGLVGCGLVGGCGGDENNTANTTSSGSSSGTAVDWGAYCDARAALQCAQFDAALCKDQETCGRVLIRDEVEAQILECLRGTCLWESCLTKTSDVPRSSAGEAFFNACVKRTAECALNNDSCYAGDLIADAGVGELSACLQLASCAETDTCMTNYFAAHFTTCAAWH